jgi:hypothetical protein
MGPQEEDWVSYALGQTEELLRQLLCHLEFCPLLIKGTEAPEHWKELTGLPHLLAQFSCTRKGMSHFRGSIPLDHD